MATGFPCAILSFRLIVIVKPIQTMRNTILPILLAILALAPLSHAQQNIIVGNGGQFQSNPPFTSWPTVGRLNAVASPITYSSYDTIFQDQSIQDAAYISSNTIAIATTARLSTYATSTAAPLVRAIQSQPIPGINKVANVDGNIWVSRGFGTPAGGEYLLIFDEFLNLIDSVSLPNEATNILSLRVGLASVSVPGGFMSGSGYVAIINTNSNTVLHLVNLGTSGKGLGFQTLKGDSILALATGGFGADTSYLHVINSTTGLLTSSHPVTPAITRMVKQEFGTPDSIAFFTSSNQLRKASLKDWGPNLITNSTLVRTMGSPASLLFGPSFIAASVTDYISYGSVLLLNNNGTLIDSVPVGISPEVLLFERPLVSNRSKIRTLLQVYPNPASSQLNISGLTTAVHYQIINTVGQTVASSSTKGNIDISQLTPGHYQIFIPSLSQRSAFIKQ